MTQRIVVKFGTSVLTGGARQLDRPRLVEFVRQLSHLHSLGHDVIVCTSGAVAAGRAHLGFPSLPSAIVNKQLFAAVGQTRLMLQWESLFDIYGVRVGQILITRADTENRRRYLNARDTFSALLEHRIVPVVNENDAVATEEIKVGDNDNLSAMVATLVSADLLLILTDQAGLYTADPRTNPSAELIREVQHFDDLQHIHVGDSSTELGVGGMSTKIAAANTARHAGIDVVIAAGSEPNVILRVAGGEALGTRFPALESHIESRKRWILAGPKPSGRVTVDAGAVRALCRRGRSLLPAGITAVEGPFLRGDTVIVVDAERRELARGLSAYNSDDLARIAGCQSHEIEARLGYTYGDEAVHRNNLVLLTE